jgi:tetratricopeptide (TPR) repeat protein
MEAVELAAVLGSTVAMSEWADCGLETFAAEETVNALALLGLVQSRPREDRWSFVHPMVCEVLQRRASGAGRLQSLHLACARMLQRRGAEGANASRLGEHLFHAGALQECLEPLVEGFAWHRERTEYLRAMGALSLRERAVDRLGVPHTGFDRVRNDHMRASLGISQRRRVDEAERLLRRIIRVAEEEGWHDRAVDWTMELAILELRRGRHREGEALLIEALAAADDTPPDITTRLHYRLGRGRARMGDPDGARVHLDACLRIAEAANLPIRAADAHYGIANLELARGNVEATMAHLQKAVGPYSAGSRRTRVRLANALGDTARLAGDLDAAERHFSSLVVEPASGGLVFSINLGMVALERGLVGHSFRTLAAPRPAPSAEQATAHLSTAAALFQDGILVARTMDAPWLELVALSGLACCRAQTGHWHDCDTLLRDLIERLEGLVELDIANCAEVLGRSALAAGQTETGHRALRLALWLWHATERPQATQEVATLLATAGVRG